MRDRLPRAADAASDLERLRRLLVAVAWAFAACSGEEAFQTVTWQEEGHYRWRELAPTRAGGAGFTPMPVRATNIDFANRLAPQSAARHDHLLVGSGVAIGDYDADGRADVYLARLEGPNALYRNLGGWRFEEVAEEAGVEAPDRYSTGAVFADVDGDGFLDLLVTALGGPNALYRNLGNGTFEETTSEAGLSSTLGSTSATFADIDADGDLDLYVANYKVESAADVLRPYERSDMDMVVESPTGPLVAEPYREHFRIETRGGESVVAEQAEPDRLYLNSGDGRFSLVSWTDGAFVDAEGRPLERALDDFALAAAFADVDADGDADLYVANDFDDPDQLWMNDGSGRFRAAGPFDLRRTSHASMAVDFADVDRDGNLDFFVADMLSADPARRLAQVPLHGPLLAPIGDDERRPQVGRNTLFLGRGDGTWAQAAEMAGLEATEWTWGSAFADVDLDGYEDLLVANGHGRDMRDGDAFERIVSLRGTMSWDEAKALYPRLPTRNLAFRNRGALVFEEVGREWRFGEDEDVSHGLALGDLDGDGDLDVVVNRLGSSALVLRNETAAPRLGVRLAGRPPNTSAIGAKVRLRAGSAPIQEREVRAGGLYLSGSETVVSFAARPTGFLGLDEAEELEPALEIEVEWPSGAVSSLEARPGREYEIREGGAPSQPRWLEEGRGRGSGPPASEYADNGIPPLFEDVSELLAGGHRHSDTAYEGEARQPLLHWDLSRLGPGASWFDADGDATPDLVVTGGRGGRGVLFRNVAPGSEFVLRPLTDELARDQTAALPEWIGDDVRLLVGRSSFEAATPEEALSLAGVVRIGLADGYAAEEVAGGHLSAVGPLAQADVDGDGDLDLFVGGRTIPAFYPLRATSRLLLRDGLRLTEASDASREALVDLGMVSGAVFTDLDGDGAPDLVIAAEWDAPRILGNQGGVYTDRTSEWGIDTLAGLWKGVAAGDLDGDGRMDLVLSNHGLNTELEAGPDRPLWLVNGDIDRNGTWDLVLARSRSANGPLYPLERLERMRAAVPTVVRRAGSYEAYAETTVEELLGEGSESTYRSAATTLAHLVLLNRGGAFEVRELPYQAQLAPAHHVGVADFNGDGFEDVVISQNLFGTHGYAARHDSGRGLLLLGDGGGGLLPAVNSGIGAYGDGRAGAFADFDGDARLDLVIAQHGGPTRLFRNVGSRPGLRVRLNGPPGNPSGVGSRLRVAYADEPGSESFGPAREVRSGSGYWSHDDPLQVMGLRARPVAVEVRWPDGRSSRAPVANPREVTVSWHERR